MLTAADKRFAEKHPTNSFSRITEVRNYNSAIFIVFYMYFKNLEGELMSGNI